MSDGKTAELGCALAGATLEPPGRPGARGVGQRPTLPTVGRVEVRPIADGPVMGGAGLGSQLPADEAQA